MPKSNRKPRCPACRAAWIAPYRTGERWACGSVGGRSKSGGWFSPSPICESLESLTRACAANIKRVAEGAPPASARSMTPRLVAILQANIADAGAVA